MVFEAVVVEFLNKFLKQYVENLDTSQLKIGIWGGDVVLNDLKIKSTLFDDFNLPVRIKWGRLGKFAMKIPWKNLYSSQVVIDIEGLLMVIIPNIECTYDAVKEEKMAQEKKQARIKAVEEAKKRDLEGETTKQNDSFLEKLLTQITKNLQIVIRNIHIRYEDKTTVPDSPFSVGVTLSNLSAQTTTSDPTKVFPKLMQEIDHLICKAVNLEGLSIYWNSASALFSDMSDAKLSEVMLSSIPTVVYRPENFMYMFGPLSASAFLRLNPKPEIDGSNFTIPKVFLNVHLKEIDLAVTHRQFCDAMSFLQDYQRHTAAAKYKKYRPVGVPVIGHAKIWWQFANSAIMEDITRRRKEWCWENIKEHRRMCRRYSELFKMKLNSKKMTSREVDELADLEKKLNVFNLILIREKVYMELERNKEILKHSKSKGWFFWWFGGGSDSRTDLNDDELVKKLQSVMTTNEKQKLYKAIGYEESAPPTNYPPAFVQVQFWFHLDEMRMTVYDEPRRDSVPVMVLSVKSVRLEFEQRPSAFAMKFVMIIGNFQVTGKPEKGKPHPELVTSNCKESESLIEVVYETKPLDSSYDQRIIVNALPLSIIYHAHTINLLKNIFTSDASEEVEKIVAATSASLPTFRSITSMGLQYAIEKRTRLEVKIHIKSSYLIFPYGGVYHPDKDMLVLMLGSLSIESEDKLLKDISVRKLFLEGTTNEEIFSTVLSASYTKFICLLTGVQVLFQLSGEDWVAASKMRKSCMQFLEPTNLEVTIKKSLVMDDARIPKMIIEAKLPSLTFNFSEERFVNFIALACSIPSKAETNHSLSKKGMSVSSWSLQSFSNQLENTLLHRPSTSQVRPIEYLQGIDLVGHFEMNELKVNVSKTIRSDVVDDGSKDGKGGSVEEQFLNLSLIRLEIELTNKTFETINLFKLGGIDFKQYLKKNWLPFVSTRGLENDYYFFVAEYINLDTKIPDFYSARGGIINRLTLNITPLNVLLDKEALLAQIAFVGNVQRRVDWVKESSNTYRPAEGWRNKEPVLEEIGEIVHSEKKVLTKGRRFRRKSYQQEVIEFFLQASLDEITIGVEHKGEGLSEFNLKGGSIDISNRKSYSTVDVNIREVYVLDLSPTTKHSKILASLESQTLSSRVTIYNKEYFGSANTMDMSIDAEVGGIQVVCLSLFFNRAIKFLGAFQTQVESLKEGASIAAQKAKKNVVKAFHNAAQICLNVKITAPLLLIPKTSVSMDLLALDLGVLTIKNSITELDYTPVGTTNSRPLIDIVKLNLHNLKVLRCSDITIAEGERTFLVPVTFELTVKRNLSTAWFRVIPELEVLARLATVRVTLTHEDLCAIMNIVQENLSEGEKDRKADKTQSKHKMDQKRPYKVKTQDAAPRQEAPREERDVEYDEEKGSSRFYTVVKFEFCMDSFIFDALNEKKDSNSENTGLATFVLQEMSVKGRLFSDGAISTSLMLVSCILDDTRPGKEGRLTRLMERTVDANAVDPKVDDLKQNPGRINSMIEVIYQKKDLDSFVDVRVYKFTLALSMEFLQKLRVFFTLDDEQTANMEVRDHIRVPERRFSVTEAHGEERAPTFTLNLRLEKPDIIFVENMDSINTDALVFHTEMVMKCRLSGRRQIISGSFRDIELYSCCFNPSKRPHTLSQVVKPFSVSIAGSTPEGSGLHVDICLTDILININPSTVDLITKCYEALLKDTFISSQDFEEKVYSDLWEIKPFSEEEYMFLKTEIGEEALKSMRSSASLGRLDEEMVDEICLLAIPSITVYLEGMSTIRSHPSILLEMGFQMRCHNWSQKMTITSSLKVEMQYFNKTCSAWEPLLERVEKYSDQNRASHTPWELMCFINFGDEGELEGMSPPRMLVNFICDDILQLTFTKSCVEVLKVAWDTYTTAVTKHKVKTYIDLPPYIIKNETGVPIELLLEESDLQVCKSPNTAYNTVKLESNSEVELQNTKIPEIHKHTSLSVAKKECQLLVKLPTIGEKVFELPLGMSSKRFFPFQVQTASKEEVWGLVSEVFVVDQSTTVVLRSFLKIENHFNEPINIHSLSEDGTMAEFIGTVEGNSSFSLPFQACYEADKKLFFSINGYTLSTEPFPWENLKKEISFSLLLECQSKFPENQDPFFIQAVGEAEQIYYSNTKRKTISSMMFKIHLQPTLKIFNSLPVPLEICCQGNANERTLHPGNQTQITNAEPGTSTVTLRIGDYLEKEWSCKETVLKDPPEFLIWRFISYNGLTSETLSLGVHVTYTRKTAVYTIYSPYFMVNKTGHLLSYKFEQIPTVFYHPGDLNVPVLFSPTSKKFYGKKSAIVQVEQSSWSDKFPVDVAWSGGTIECREEEADVVFKISVNITLTYNGLTKIVVFTPFFVFVNTLDFVIEVKERLAPESSWQEIPSNNYLPFWPQCKDVLNTITIRPKGSSARSPPFEYQSTDNCLLKLSHECGGIFVNIKATQSGTCITFRAYEPGQAPSLVINNSGKVIKLYEAGTDYCLTLMPYQQAMHAWVCPTGCRKMALINEAEARVEIPLDQDLCGITFVSKDEGVQYVSFLHGVQRVLLFSEDQGLLYTLSSIKLSVSGIEVVFKMYGIGVSLVNNITRVEILYMELLSSGIMWEGKKQGKSRFKQLKIEEAYQLESAYQSYLEDKETNKRTNAVVNLPDKLVVDFEKMEIVKPTMKSLKRTFEPGLWLAYRKIEDQTLVHLKINKIQVDSQLYEAIFPVVLSVVPPPKTVAQQDPKPFFELSMVKVADQKGIEQYKYFKTLIQEFHVKIDIAFLQQVYLFLAAEDISDEQHKMYFKKDLAFTEKPLKDHIEVVSVNEQKSYFGLLHFPPLKIHFSFSLAGKLESNDHLPPSLSVLLQSLGITLTDVHDVVFRLSYLERKGVFLTKQELQKEVMSHYLGQIIRQAYVLLLGLDVIGNPYGLIVGIGEGVEAFFYEPFQGMIQGPSEFGKGMAIGCRSLFGHTVASAAGTLGKLTETLGKGLAVLSLDKEYQMQRMVEQNRHENIQASMARGGKGLVMGVVEGVSGVVQKPIQGAKEEGVGGFFKGVGKGLMGLMTRPVTGVVDFASTSLNAVKRATALSIESKRLRPPRYFRDEEIVEPYNLRAAQGNLIFLALNKGKYSTTDKYEYHLYLKEKEIVLLTNKRIILAEHSEVFGTWQVPSMGNELQKEHMAITWKSMPERPRCHTKGVALTMPHRQGQSSKDKPDVKVLLVEDELVRTAMCQRMLEFYQMEKEMEKDRDSVSSD